MWTAHLTINNETKVGTLIDDYGRQQCQISIIYILIIGNCSVRAVSRVWDFFYNPFISPPYYKILTNKQQDTGKRPMAVYLWISNVATAFLDPVFINAT